MPHSSQLLSFCSLCSTFNPSVLEMPRPPQLSSKSSILVAFTSCSVLLSWSLVPWVFVLQWIFIRWEGIPWLVLPLPTLFTIPFGFICFAHSVVLMLSINCWSSGWHYCVGILCVLSSAVCTPCCWLVQIDVFPDNMCCRLWHMEIRYTLKSGCKSEFYYRYSGWQCWRLSNLLSLLLSFLSSC